MLFSDFKDIEGLQQDLDKEGNQIDIHYLTNKEYKAYILDVSTHPTSTFEIQGKYSK